MGRRRGVWEGGEAVPERRGWSRGAKRSCMASKNGLTFRASILGRTPTNLLLPGCTLFNILALSTFTSLMGGSFETRLAQHAHRSRRAADAGAAPPLRATRLTARACETKKIQRGQEGGRGGSWFGWDGGARSK